MVAKTGITTLDKELDGGIPEGSMITFIADPMLQGDSFIQYFLSISPTLYFSTFRSPQQIQQQYDIEKEIETIDIRSIEHLKDKNQDNIGEKDEMVDYILEKINKSNRDKNIVFDTFSDVVGIDGWREILYLLSETVKENESIAYLYLVGKTSQMENIVLRASDIIFNIDIETGENNVRTLLTIPKIRNKSSIRRVFRINIRKTDIIVDTSKEI